MKRDEKQQQSVKKDEKQSLKPEEAPTAALPQENAMAYFGEAPSVEPLEAPQPAEVAEICGIGGCQTIHTEWVVMKRHKERVHNIPPTTNRNQPKARNAEVRLA